MSGINWGGSSSGGGGGSDYVLPTNLQRINENLAYDPSGEGSFVSSVDIEIPLNTLRWSDQWAMSSGGKSMFFQSADQDTDFTPIVSGIKNQSVPANQDISGVVYPFFRRYSSDLIQGSLKGNMSTNSADNTPYEGVTALTTNIAVFGVRAVLGEPLQEGDRLVYRLWDGTDDTGAMIFTQSLTVTADRAIGFDFTGWWSHPAEGFNGENVYARIVVQPQGDKTNERTLLVRSIDSDPNTHWNELQYRTFEDVKVQYKGKPIVASTLPNGYKFTNGDDGTTVLVNTSGRNLKLDQNLLDEGFYMRFVNATASNMSIGAINFGRRFLVNGGERIDPFDASNLIYIKPYETVEVFVIEDDLFVLRSDYTEVLEKFTGEAQLDALKLKNFGAAMQANSGSGALPTVTGLTFENSGGGTFSTSSFTNMIPDVSLVKIATVTDQFADGSMVSIRVPLDSTSITSQGYVVFSYGDFSAQTDITAFPYDSSGAYQAITKVVATVSILRRGNQILTSVDFEGFSNQGAGAASSGKNDAVFDISTNSPLGIYLSIPLDSGVTRTYSMGSLTATDLT